MASSATYGGLGLEGIGTGFQLYGAYEGVQASKSEYAAQSQIAQLQQQESDLSWNQAQLTGRRNQMEVLRNEQRSRSLALSNATSGGAQFGSGLSGGFGQVQGTSGNNLLGINQNLRIGAQKNVLDQQITQQKLAYGQAQSQASTAQGFSALGGGIASLGKDLISAAPLLV